MELFLFVELMDERIQIVNRFQINNDNNMSPEFNVRLSKCKCPKARTEYAIDGLGKEDWMGESDRKHSSP